MKNLFSTLRKPQNIRRIIIVILIVIVVGAYLYFQKTNNRVQIDNSLIEAPIISISPSSPGKLTELDAVEGHMVKTGDTLAVVGSETLRSDTDGMIISAPDEVGGDVSNQIPLIQMIRTEDLRVDGTIDENKGLDALKVGQVVSFTVDALPGKTYWGYVDEIASSAKQTQLSFSISSERPTQQFDVYARFDANNYPQIKNGMSAKMTVFTNE